MMVLLDDFGQRQCQLSNLSSRHHAAAHDSPPLFGRSGPDASEAELARIIWSLMTAFLGDDVEPGTRVKVVRDPDWAGPWRQEFVGTIEGPAVPVRVINLAEMPEVNVPDADRGPMREFFVRFDEPQQDCDGTGPYYAAVIWEKYLRRAARLG